GNTAATSIPGHRIGRGGSYHVNHQIVQPDPGVFRVADVSTEAAETYIRAAQNHMATDRRGCMASLYDMFYSGDLLGTLDGRYVGERDEIALAPGLTGLIETIQRRQRPLLGKWFAADQAQGENILAMEARPALRLTHPFYRDMRLDTSSTIRALRFRTYP